MEISKVIPSVLCMSDGKCVCVQVRRKPSPSHHQLVTVNMQADNKGVVQVYEIEYERTKCMAFCFELGDKAIFPFTDGKDVKFTELSSQQMVTKDMLNTTFLFQWGEAGSNDWRSLKSVAEPSMYLFFEDTENKVTIKPVELPLFRIVQKDSTRTSELQRNWIPKQLDRKTPYERVSFLRIGHSNHGPSFCEATAISTKSACHYKRKPKKMRRSLKDKCF